MPSINRIRVNNVKYNFGTQFYDDFTMRMYGKNTLYDLANGGGKSVLMLLLLQNMIPNCTLDEKQPIEKLFRTGNGNTTIHSLVEWKLDEVDSTEGYRYMTTGFCARKAKDESETEAKKDVASVEYFNYCIFYREYNKNDIVNLPLVKDGERITYQGLRTYLKDLEHKDMSLKVQVFERKGEYQRFISRYGLHESQWEIIRGINKTEGHVRTYFENNYKTTRKVVEDLLIEEIIEKAYMVKTERDEDGSDSMAKMLMDIKEQLTVLAKKKKDIASYDHQTELVSVLRDKVASFSSLYQEQTSLSDMLASICVTGEEFAKEDEEKMTALTAKRDEKWSQKNNQRQHIESLKVAKDKRTIDELKGEVDSLLRQHELEQKRIDDLKLDMELKESINDYLEYIEDRKKYYMHDAVIKNMMQEASFDEELLYTYVYNIKMRTDVVLADIRRQIEELTESILKSEAAYAYHDKLLREAETELAVIRSTKKNSDEEIVRLSERLSEIRMSMHNIKFTQYKEQQEDSEQELFALEQKLANSESIIDECKRLLNEELLNQSLFAEKQESNDKIIESLSAREQEFKEAYDKLQNIKQVYGCVDDESRLADVLGERITSAIIEIEKLRRDINASDRRKKRLAEGRLIDISDAARKIIDYIETRHGVSAMYGMDYLSALPVDKQRQVLETNPELPYGVVTASYDEIKDDENIYSVETNDVYVNIYDIDKLDGRGMYFGENAFAVHKGVEQLTDAGIIDKLTKAEETRCRELMLTLEMKEEVLAAYRQDQMFVYRISDSEFKEAGEKLERARKERDLLTDKLTLSETKIAGYRNNIAEEENKVKDTRREYEKCLEDINKLYTIGQLSEVISKNEDTVKKCEEDITRLEQKINELTIDADDGDRSLAEERARLQTLKKRMEDISADWDANYKTYYNIDHEYDVLTLSDDELQARFIAMVNAGSEDAKTIEDKRLLMDTLSVSMERLIKGIEKRGTDVKKLSDLEARGLLYHADDEVLKSAKRSIDDARQQLKETDGKIKDKESAINRLLGSVSYAISNIEASFGKYEETDASLSEIVQSLESGEELLKRLEREAKECDDELKRYSRQQGYMVDLYKDVKRIIVTNDISLEGVKPFVGDKDKLRETFENTLLAYDKSTKSLERAQHELLKFKGNTASALDQMEVYELAQTIRDDVMIPDNKNQAKELMDSLESIIDYIRLERDRVSKSLVDMETIKQNFEEQCLQRCLDVRSELDKLPKLSHIMSEGESIQMVGLNIPYVKEEFLRQRMSDYIDKIVAQADDYDNDRERMKFIRNSLALKKLFGVIVTDMNGIKLSLYKRERIKEQSRYLKYEEAVGSTGQSQGIYIQFLISIINYISGMYQFGNEGVRTKTIFIDNPFGAAKDVYIWEPIFAMLKANNVQLIVPARGATPAITGRFDVNYILGQQMSGGRQLTVVTDYTSKVDQEELEYQDLEYEQVSFDFI